MRGSGIHDTGGRVSVRNKSVRAPTARAPVLVAGPGMRDGGREGQLADYDRLTRELAAQARDVTKLRKIAAALARGAGRRHQAADGRRRLILAGSGFSSL